MNRCHNKRDGRFCSTGSGLPASIEKFKSDVRVADIVDERGDKNGYWLYLKPGFIDQEAGISSIHEFNSRDIKRRLNYVNKVKGKF